MQDTSAVPVREKRIERVALADQVYEVLQERIFDQTYAPGQKLNVDALGRELSVSSTPIREALNRLAAEGLVHAAAFVGFAVAALPDRKFFEDLYDLRRILEPWAAAEAARLRPAAALRTLGETVQVMRTASLSREYRAYRAFAEADGRFHRGVVAASGNDVARETYDGLRVHLHMSRLFISREPDVEVGYRRHLDIFEAIEAGRREEASGLMRAQLDESQCRLLGEPPRPVSPS
jgi:DNA-binding GntR family transcriptional regulator